MKINFPDFIKIKSLLFIGFFSLLSYRAQAQSTEFLIVDKEITWGTDATHGFSFLHPDGTMPSNWLSPVDFYNGQMYTRYEILSVATDTPCGMQFGIFQYQPQREGYTSESELCEDVRWLNDGVGSVADYHSSPSTWWANGGGVDFSRVSDFSCMCPTIWCKNPASVVSPAGSGGDDLGIAWSKRFNWFPITVRVTIVAVGAGYTFSGWDNYLGDIPAAPSYTINYFTEKTNQSVPSTDEYSYSSFMSPAYSGTGSQLVLTPGEDVYFRVKEDGGTPASAIQHLVVPDRSSAPSFSINFTGENTSGIVTSDIEYSTSASFTGTLDGAGIQIAVTPGQDIYFRKKATSSSFASGAFLLDCPSRPAAPPVSIDYDNEKTNEVLFASVEYSTNASMAGSTDCGNAKLALSPGTDLYFRVKVTTSSFASLISTLDVPERPSTPAIIIDYPSESTSVIASTLEWSENPSLSAATQGQGSSIAVTPETDLYFRVKTTASSFSSAIQHLDIPGRQTTPVYTINYQDETTNESIFASDDYSTSTNMSGALAGTSSKLTLNPGTNLYIRTRATGSSFQSAVQSLDVSPRPAAPIFNIDFIAGTTAEPVGETIEYSNAADITDAINGTGMALPLEPGKNLYFRQKAGSSAFKSDVFELAIPGRNQLVYTGADTITDNSFVLYAILLDGVSEFSLDDLNIINGIAQNLRAGNTFDIYPASEGLVKINIPANTHPENSFASNEVIVYKKMAMRISSLNSENGVNFHPNPCYNGIVHIETESKEPCSIVVISNTGMILREIQINNDINHELNLQDLKPGIYFLKFYTATKVSIQKLILK
jgi:hypothetical protein